MKRSVMSKKINLHALPDGLSRDRVRAVASALRKVCYEFERTDELAEGYENETIWHAILYANKDNSGEIEKMVARLTEILTMKGSSVEDGGWFSHRKAYLQGLILQAFDELGDTYSLQTLAEEQDELLSHLIKAATTLDQWEQVKLWPPDDDTEDGFHVSRIY